MHARHWNSASVHTLLLCGLLLACGTKDGGSTSDASTGATSTSSTPATSTTEEVVPTTSGVNTGSTSMGMETSGSTGPAPANPTCQAWVDHLILCSPREAPQAQDYLDGCSQEIDDAQQEVGPMCAAAIESFYACDSMTPCDFQGIPCMAETAELSAACD